MRTVLNLSGMLVWPWIAFVALTEMGVPMWPSVLIACTAWTPVVSLGIIADSLSKPPVADATVERLAESLRDGIVLSKPLSREDARKQARRLLDGAA